jgi:site-specific recombinase XerD
MLFILNPIPIPIASFHCLLVRGYISLWFLHPSKELFQKMIFGKPDELVFPNRDGKRMKHISKTFDETVEKLGLNRGITDSRYKAVYHSLRHTHASRLLESGVDIYHVKELLGHQSVQTTERYTHARDETLKNAVKSMEEKIIKPQKSNHLT